MSKKKGVYILRPAPAFSKIESPLSESPGARLYQSTKAHRATLDEIETNTLQSDFFLERYPLRTFGTSRKETFFQKKKK